MKKSIIEPFSDDDVDKRLVLAVLAVSLIASAMLFIANISSQFTGFLVFVLSITFVLAWRGNLKLAGWLAPLAGLVIFTLLMFENYGIRDTAVLGLPVIIVAGSLMNGRRGVVLFGLASLVAVLFIWAAEDAGLAGKPMGMANALADYLVVCVTIILTIAMQWSVVVRLDEKNRRANRELAERRQAETQLRNSEQLYRRAIDAAGAVPYYRDLSEQKYTFMGEGILQITGYPAEEMTPQVWDALELEGFPRGKLTGLTYEEADQLTESDHSVTWECDYRIRTRDGQIRWVADTAIVGFNARGEQAGVVGILQDITERKQSEQQIQQRLQELAAIHAVSQAAASELKLDALFDLVSDELIKLFDVQEIYFALHNPQKNEVDFPYYRHGNQRIETAPVRFGQGLSSKVIQTRQPLLINSDYAQRSKELGVIRFSSAPGSIEQVSWLGVPIQAGEQVIGMVCVMNLQRENTFTEADVRLLTTIASNVGIAIQNAQLFTTVQQELTERKRAEEMTQSVNFELQRRVKELYVLNDVARAGASVRSENELLETVVESLHRSLYPEIIGVALWDEQAGLLRTHPSAHRGLPPRFAEMTARPNEGVVGKVAATCLPYRVKDISDPVYLAINPEICSELCVPILAGDRLVGVLDVESKHPDAFSDADENLLFTIAGQLASALERLRAEQQLRTLNSELEQRVAERTLELEAAYKELESFSYTVSHDLRTPLRAISSYTRIIKDEFSGTIDHKGVEFLEKVLGSSQRMNRLIDDLLSFSRTSRRAIGKVDVDLNAPVRMVIEALAPETAGRQIEWVIADLPPALADSTLIHQVFANLIGNAVKYSRNRTPARIEVGYLEKDGETIYFVKDNGAGFDMKYVNKLFGVFQRLHHDDEFEGTGIGLATVQRIIQRHGGRIWAEAELDKGATFYFTLG